MGAGPPWLSPPVAAPAVAPSTLTVPAMPASLWPGMEQMNPRPSAGIVTVPVAVCPASAAMTVPSAKVTSWMMEPVLTNLTSYVPAAGTVIAAGVKPRSKLSISIVPVAAASAAPGVPAGWSTPAAGADAAGAAGAVAAGKVQPGALADVQAVAVRATSAMADGEAMETHSSESFRVRPGRSPSGSRCRWPDIPLPGVASGLRTNYH